MQQLARFALLLFAVFCGIALLLPYSPAPDTAGTLARLYPLLTWKLVDQVHYLELDPAVFNPKHAGPIEQAVAGARMVQINGQELSRVDGLFDKPGAWPPRGREYHGSRSSMVLQWVDPQRSRLRIVVKSR